MNPQRDCEYGAHDLGTLKTNQQNTKGREQKRGNCKADKLEDPITSTNSSQLDPDLDLDLELEDWSEDFPSDINTALGAPTAKTGISTCNYNHDTIQPTASSSSSSIKHKTHTGTYEAANRNRARPATLNTFIDTSSPLETKVLRSLKRKMPDQQPRLLLPVKKNYNINNNNYDEPPEDENENETVNENEDFNEGFEKDALVHVDGRKLAKFRTPPTMKQQYAPTSVKVERDEEWDEDDDTACNFTTGSFSGTPRYSNSFFSKTKTRLVGTTNTGIERSRDGATETGAAADLEEENDEIWDGLVIPDTLIDFNAILQQKKKVATERAWSEVRTVRKERLSTSNSALNFAGSSSSPSSSSSSPSPSSSSTNNNTTNSPTCTTPFIAGFEAPDAAHLELSVLTAAAAASSSSPSSSSSSSLGLNTSLTGCGSIHRNVKISCSKGKGSSWGANIGNRDAQLSVSKSVSKSVSELHVPKVRTRKSVPPEPEVVGTNNRTGTAVTFDRPYGLVPQSRPTPTPTPTTSQTTSSNNVGLNFKLPVGTTRRLLSHQRVLPQHSPEDSPQRPPQKSTQHTATSPLSALGGSPKKRVKFEATGTGTCSGTAHAHVRSVQSLSSLRDPDPDASEDASDDAAAGVQLKVWARGPGVSKTAATVHEQQRHQQRHQQQRDYLPVNNLPQKQMSLKEQEHAEPGASVLRSLRSVPGSTGRPAPLTRKALEIHMESHKKKDNQAPPCTTTTSRRNQYEDRKQPVSKAKLGLIRQLQTGNRRPTARSTFVRGYNGMMRFNVETFSWEGNNEDLDRFQGGRDCGRDCGDRGCSCDEHPVKPTHKHRPGLIAYVSTTATGGPGRPAPAVQVVGDMLFDAVNMKWVNLNVSKEEGIEDVFGDVDLDDDDDDDLGNKNKSQDNKTQDASDESQERERNFCLVRTSTPNSAVDINLNVNINVNVVQPEQHAQLQSDEFNTNVNSMTYTTNTCDDYTVGTEFDISTDMVRKFRHEEKRWPQKVRGWFEPGPVREREQDREVDYTREHLEEIRDMVMKGVK